MLLAALVAHAPRLSRTYALQVRDRTLLMISASLT